jgi:hypothetical protein
METMRQPSVLTRICGSAWVLLSIPPSFALFHEAWKACKSGSACWAIVVACLAALFLGVGAAGYALYRGKRWAWKCLIALLPVVAVLMADYPVMCVVEGGADFRLLVFCTVMVAFAVATWIACFRDMQKARSRVKGSEPEKQGKQDWA